MPKHKGVRSVAKRAKKKAGRALARLGSSGSYRAMRKSTKRKPPKKLKKIA